jgi:hypothetical protein
LDLNELLSRHQIALIAMAHAPTVPGREWAEECADYYATCIVTARRKLGASDPVNSHRAMKRIIRD